MEGLNWQPLCQKGMGVSFALLGRKILSGFFFFACVGGFGSVNS